MYKVEVKTRTPNYEALKIIENEEDRQNAELFISAVASFDSSYETYDVVNLKESIKLVFLFNGNACITTNELFRLETVAHGKYSGSEFRFKEKTFTVEFMRHNINRILKIVQKHEFHIQDEHNVRVLKSSTRKTDSTSVYTENTAALKKYKTERYGNGYSK